MTTKQVPVAYVTKFSGPIQVWRNAGVSDGGYLYHEQGTRHGFCRPDEWTPSMDTAKARWKAREEAKLKGAKALAVRIQEALKTGPEWEER